MMTDGELKAEESKSEDDGQLRRVPRSPIVLKVEYKRLNTFFYDYTKNISKGGTFIKTDRPLGIGTIFLFRLVVPVAAEPIELRGEVRWVVAPGDHAATGAGGAQEPGMGIRFVYREPEERAQLERTVENMMVKSLGQLIYSRLLGRDRPDAGV